MILLMLAGATALTGLILRRLQEVSSVVTPASGPAPAPVEVAPIEHGAITLRRTFSGTLAATAEFVVAPKVGGRLQRLSVDLGDPVQRGQVVAWLDDEEYRLAVAQAEAERAVAEANRAEARSALEIATRALARIESLHARGVASETEYDEAQSDELAKRTRLEVAGAQITRAEAVVARAEVQLQYTRVTADWMGGDDLRVVAERLIDEGDTVAANARLLSIVELDPVTAVVYVPERDYAQLRVGLAVELVTDAYPDRTFAGVTRRVAPVFRQSTRQARVEITVPNPEHELKPGMFVRALIVLDHVESATIVPWSALTERDDEQGLFLVDGSGQAVDWLPVRTGVREGDRVQILAEGLRGQVVTLGQQLCEDGARITIPGLPRSVARPVHE